jgi:hypothetical protein
MRPGEDHFGDLEVTDSVLDLVGVAEGQDWSEPRTELTLEHCFDGDSIDTDCENY